MKKTLAERFWAKVNKNGPLPNPYVVKFYGDIEGQRCWEWTASRNHKRYGNFGIETEDGWRIEKAHRVAWFLETGRWPVPCGLHKCDNGSCVRFSHLYEGSTGDNNREREAKGRSNHPSARWLPVRRAVLYLPRILESDSCQRDHPTW
jgi:hypothetical protein